MSRLRGERYPVYFYEHRGRNPAPPAAILAVVVAPPHPQGNAGNLDGDGVMDPRARAVGHQLGLPTEAEEAEPNTLTEVSALMEYEETGDGIRKIMRESDIGWPSTDEDAASLDARDDDLPTIDKHDNKLTRHLPLHYFSSVPSSNMQPPLFWLEFPRTPSE